MDAQVELVCDAKATLGEGPIWDNRANVLWWVDIVGKRLHSYDPTTNRDQAFELGEMIGAVVVRKSGGLVLALENGFANFDPTTNAVDPICDPESDLDLNRFNDGKCDPCGRFWAGSMAKDQTPRCGALYSLDASGLVVRRLSDISVANGIAWSSDHRTMFYIDSPTMRVDAFDFEPESGEISNRRIVVNVPIGMGYPDGMSIDSEDKLWVGMWDGGHVVRYDPATGSLITKIKLPVTHVTSCAFGGSDLRDLYITTARHGVSNADLEIQPHAGGLFRARVAVPGAHSFEFAD